MTSVQSSTFFLADSNLVRAALAHFYPAWSERLHVVSNGVDLERFQPARRADRGLALRRRLGLAPNEPCRCCWSVWTGTTSRGHRARLSSWK